MRVTVFEAGGLGDNTRRIIWAEANTQQGYLAQNDPTLHFGVNGNNTVDILVEFHGGGIATVMNVATNATYLILEDPPL
jgi:hypothetical protein